jgi:hypothetical protein
MRRSKTALAAAGALLALSAQAGLVGDTVYVGIYVGDINNLSTIQEAPIPIDVRPGRRDEVTIGCCTHINVNAETVHVRFSIATQGQWGDIGTFNGIKITGMNFRGAKIGVEGLRYTLSTNMLEELCNVCEPYGERVIVGPDWVALDLRRLLYRSDSWLDLMIVSTKPWAPPRGGELVDD